MFDRIWVRLYFIPGNRRTDNWDREETMYCTKSINLIAWGNKRSMINNDPFWKNQRKWGLGVCHLFVKLRDHFCGDFLECNKPARQQRMHNIWFYLYEAQNIESESIVKIIVLFLKYWLRDKIREIS